MACKICGSFAINLSQYDREVGVDTDLCDVHYWQNRSLPTRVEVCEITQSIVETYLNSPYKLDTKERIALVINAWLKGKK